MLYVASFTGLVIKVIRYAKPFNLMEELKITSYRYLLQLDGHVSSYNSTSIFHAYHVAYSVL